jgi:hypothetical protein
MENKHNYGFAMLLLVGLTALMVYVVFFAGDSM